MSGYTCMHTYVKELSIYIQIVYVIPYHAKFYAKFKNDREKDLFPYCDRGQCPNCYPVLSGILVIMFLF